MQSTCSASTKSTKIWVLSPAPKTQPIVINLRGADFAVSVAGWKMSMDVTFLGTGAAYPSPTRGASAVVLRCEGECWLFDCGEGTQTQLMKSQLKAG